MRTLVGLTLFAALGVLAFKLFEPVFVYTSGWADMPRSFPAGTAQAAGDWRDTAGELDALLIEARAKLNAPSVSAAISVDGQIVWANAIGFANIDTKTPATPATAYRLGSTSKAVTAVMAGVLIGKGAIDLEAPLTRYMPDLGQPMAGLTVRQIMSHTGGVRNYGLCLCFPVWEHLNTAHFDGTQRETLRAFESDALIFKPGKGFAYTSLGYNALGGVIEAASGKRFGAFLAEAVTGPLGMTATGLDDGRPDQARATAYETADGDVKGRAPLRYKPAYPVDNSNKYPSGGLVATPSDMTRLGHAMIAASLFSADVRDRLIDPQELDDGTPNEQGYALGWRYNGAAKILNGAKSVRRFGHHGTAQGTTSYFAVYPDQGVAISVIMNKGQENLDALSPHALALSDAVFAEMDRRRAGAN
jgi:CubicO group peptidase (beta-lactamase class C family)